MEPTRRLELIKAQKALAAKKAAPMFAPSSGYCYNCREDIVSENWATSLITGCPRCCRSFCN